MYNTINTINKINNYDITVDFNNWIRNKNNQNQHRSEEQIAILKTWQLALLSIQTDDIFYCTNMFENLMKQQLKNEMTL
jgi:hypothetical protein